jgi:hypothetical protein
MVIDQNGSIDFPNLHPNYNMSTQLQNKSRKPYYIRAIFDWVMGGIYLGVGFVLTFAIWLGIRIHFPPADIAQIFGVACMIYGGFRIFRGFKTRHAL